MVEFAKKVGIVAGAAIAVIGLSGVLWSASTAGLKTERSARLEADSLSNLRINRLADIVELAVVVVVEGQQSQQGADALESLRRRRQVYHP